MSDRSLKKSLAGKSNLPADENLDLFSVNRGASLDVLLKRGREQAKSKAAKPGADDEKKHGNDQLYTIPEVPLGTLSRLVLEARNTTTKLQSISTTRTGSRSESDPSSRPTRSSSTIRPSNIPTIRSSSAPKKTTITTSASASSPKRTVSRSLTPVSRKTPSPSPTPSRISTTTSTTPSFKKGGDAQRSRSLTPRSKPLIATDSSKTNVRSASVSSRGSCVRRDGCTSVSTTPQTPPRVKEQVTLAFGRPVGTAGNVNSPKRNTSPDVTRTRPKGHSTFSSLIPTFSGITRTTATPKSVKPSATLVESTKPGKKLSKASVQMAINHLDVARNGKVSTHAFSSTMLYPHSIRSSSKGLRKPYGTSSEGSSSSNQEEEEGKSLTKEEGNTENKNDSARYDALLNVKDVKDTNWLLNIDDESHHSLIFDNAFDSPPDLFPPL